MPQKGLSATIRAIFVSACWLNCPSVRDACARARVSHKIWCNISSHKWWSSMLVLNASPPSYRWAEGREVVSSGDVGEGWLSSRLYQHWVVASRRMLRRNVHYSKPLQHCLHQRQESASHLTLAQSSILTDEVAAFYPCEHAVRVGLADAVLLNDMLGVSSSACSTRWSSLTYWGINIGLWRKVASFKGHQQWYKIKAIHVDTPAQGSGTPGACGLGNFATLQMDKLGFSQKKNKKAQHKRVHLVLT